MPSMLENLIAGAVTRTDNKRILPTRRPLPTRQRDLLELFMTLGQQATLPALIESCDLRQADARHMTFITLGRWPTREELAAQPEPYNPRIHLRTLLVSEEFRTHLIRRICDAYPERPRFLYVRIPRCAGGHFMHMAGTMHSIFPPDLDRWKKGDLANFIPALGTFLGRFNFTRTTGVAQPRLAPFIQAAVPVPADPGLPWTLNPPPRRPVDRLFTILREPTGLMLSQANAILTQLRTQPGDPDLADWRGRLGALPSDQDQAGWKALGNRLLPLLRSANPICTALGEGTAATALDACRFADIEITDISLYHDWIKYTWDVEPEPATNVSHPFLTREDLDAPAQTHLERLTAEDAVFYAPVAAALAKLGPMKTSLRGGDL